MLPSPHFPLCCSEKWWSIGAETDDVSWGSHNDPHRSVRIHRKTSKKSLSETNRYSTKKVLRQKIFWDITEENLLEILEMLFLIDYSLDVFLVLCFSYVDLGLKRGGGNPGVFLMCKLYVFLTFSSKSVVKPPSSACIFSPVVLH